jgi:hypothetical protein
VLYPTSFPGIAEEDDEGRKEGRKGKVEILFIGKVLIHLSN